MTPRCLERRHGKGSDEALGDGRSSRSARGRARGSAWSTVAARAWSIVREEGRGTIAANGYAWSFRDASADADT